MAREPYNRAFRPTIPVDLVDPPRFGQPTELVKDVLVAELKKFLSSAEQSTERRIELPTVEKYATFSSTLDPFATVTEVIRKMPDRDEPLPHVAVSAATGSERKLTIGPPVLALVQDAARVEAALPEPYALTDGDTLELQTTPDGLNSVLETVIFTSNRFPPANPISAALASDIAAEINAQCEHAHAEAFESGGNNYLRILAGGWKDDLKGSTPTTIEIGSGSSTGVSIATELGRTGDVTDIGGTVPDVELTAPAGAWSLADVGNYIVLTNASKGYFNNGRFLITDFSTDTVTDTLTIENKYGRAEVGSPATWFIGARDTWENPTRPPKWRYAESWDLGIEISVFAEDENSRGELADLVASFFSFFLESQFFTFNGRTGYTGQTTENEYFQIVLVPPMRNASEAEFPRPAGDGTTKLYVNTFSISAIVTQFLDREAFWPGTTDSFIIKASNLVEDVTLPLSGD